MFLISEVPLYSSSAWPRNLAVMLLATKSLHSLIMRATPDVYGGVHGRAGFSLGLDEQAQGGGSDMHRDVIFASEACLSVLVARIIMYASPASAFVSSSSL